MKNKTKLKTNVDWTYRTDVETVNNAITQHHNPYKMREINGYDEMHRRQMQKKEYFIYLKEHLGMLHDGDQTIS